MMKQLLWKDYRLARPVILLIALVFAVVYGTGVVMEVQNAWPRRPSAKNLGEMLASYGTVALYMTFMMTALLGGHSIACERADRSAHFLACLPPTKRQIILSKLIVAAVPTAIVFAWLKLSMSFLSRWLGADSQPFGGEMTLAGAAMTSALTFGVGWLASAKLESTLVPIILAVASPIVLGMSMLAIGRILNIPTFEIGDRAGPTCLVLGIIAFAAGTWVYVHRVEP